MKHRIGTPDALPGDEDVVEGYTKPGIKQLMLILSSGMLTASLSSAVLGNFISWLVVVCRWFGINPGMSIQTAVIKRSRLPTLDAKTTSLRL
jgi:hypothetical protein